MPEIIESVRLILVEIGENSNKQWVGELFDNGDVRTRWGRIGLGEQSKMFPGAGASFLKKKEAEKIKKGYTLLKTLPSGGTTQTVAVTGDLLDIARKQIVTNSPILDGLISRLVKANVHSITSSTQISYNSTTGLFTTPLGIVTLDGINEGRALLAECAQLVDKGDWTNALEKTVSSFLRIVPQNIGMKRLDVRNFFPDVSAITKQNDILDSLEASYKALQTTPVANSPTPTQEQVFKVKMSVLDDKKERDRIVKKYRDTRKDMHVCAHLKVKEIYVVEIEDNAKAFQLHMDKSKPANVFELWHGTKQANLLSIMKSGLRVSPPSTARIAGKMFGNGVYFASDSTKSLNYSFGYWDGKTEKNCFMFLAQVAMGNYYVPRGSYESLPKSGFDSTWAKSGQSGIRNDEYIVYQDNRFRLQYLVEFE